MIDVYKRQMLGVLMAISTELSEGVFEDAGSFGICTIVNRYC